MKFFKKRWGKTSALFITIIFFLIVGEKYQDQAFSLHFVDEEETLAIANYVITGDVLYKDLFSNHQPLPYLLSAGVQEVTQPNSIFLLIKRHRESIIVWSAIWSLLLVARFGWPLLLTIIIIELTKIYLLGNVFLAESLVIYPLLYIVSFLMEIRIRTKRELVFIGFCFSLIVSLLAPLWPLSFVLFIWLLLCDGQGERSLSWGKIGTRFLLQIVGMVPVGFAVLYFSSFPDYLIDAIDYNLRYFIPIASHDPTWLVVIKGFTAPLGSFFVENEESATLIIIRMLSILFILCSVVLLSKKSFIVGLGLFVILGLSNLRYVEPGLQMYQGFHLLPWYSILCLSTVLSMRTLLTYPKMKYIKGIAVGVFIITLVVILNYSLEDLFKSRDTANDFYVNYSRQFDMGEAVRILKNETDTLFVVPDEWLVYWQAQIPHASFLLGYYAWMNAVPDLSKEVHRMFNTSPPTYFYCDCNSAYFGLEKYLTLYNRLKKDGNNTNLYVLKGKELTITSEQRQQLDFYNLDL